MVDVLYTKLLYPRATAQTLQREGLITRLNDGLRSGKAVTLISAPAGYGKSVLGGLWVDQLMEPVAWLSLDAQDDDPSRFFTYLIAALQQVDESLGWELETMLRAGELPPEETIISILVNDTLQNDRRFMLVLDDFHLIRNNIILAILATFVTNLPPALHFVIITREDPPLPLARLRAQNRLNEIRAADLRLNRNEVATFLSAMIGQSLEESQITTLQDKTEGWITGLQLVALAMQQPGDLAQRIAELNGSHHHILTYFTDEVLAQQPEAARHFLLQTSILDRLAGDLCDAVTGRDDGQAQLEELARANLFLMPLDDERRWYQVHQLFADVLRDIQSAQYKAETVHLHQHASQWYAHAGMIHEAVNHALAAQDYPAVVELLENHAMEMVMHGNARMLNNWVAAIPADYAKHSLRTHLAFAWMHLLRGAYLEATPYLETIQDELTDAEDEDTRSTKAEWLVMQSLLQYMQGNPIEGIRLARQAIEIVPEQDQRVSSLAHYALGSNHQLSGSPTQAVESFQRAMQQGRVADNLIAELLSTINLALLFFERGQLHLVREIISPVQARMERVETIPPISAVIYGVLAEIHYQWCVFDQACSFALHTLDLSSTGGYNSALILGRVQLSRLALIQGKLDAATAEIQAAADLAQAQAPGHIRHEVVAQQVNVYIARDQLDMTEMLLQGHGFSFQGSITLPDLNGQRPLTYPLGLLYNSGLRLLLHRAYNRRRPSDLRVGLPFVDRLISQTQEDQQTLIALDALLIRAQMHALLNDDAASLSDYTHALKLGQPEQLVAIFIEHGSPVAEVLTKYYNAGQLKAIEANYIERILATFSALKMQSSTLLEPLTDRELEILRLMAAGLKYREIGDTLFISLNTVRYHVKGIYSKLNVNTRLQALETARKHHLL